MKDEASQRRVAFHAWTVQSIGSLPGSLMRQSAFRILTLLLAVSACAHTGCRTWQGAFERRSYVQQPVMQPLLPCPEHSTDRESRTELAFLESYRPGKVPVVLIHGLFSEPETWTAMVGDLQACPSFAERYQIWTFRYPTGQGFLQSAAALRRELRAAVDRLDPQAQDAALRQMVLVGHSMGGLIAKLQVTYSDEWVWMQVANRPLEEIATTPDTRAFLAETCYFHPSPDVARVIFIASPHDGALYSSSLVGRGVAHWIQPTPDQAAMHAQLMHDNPDTFNPQLEARFPTSIDMLRSDSPLLAAMQKMKIRPGVKLHTILGATHPISLDGPSDGVVSVYSASHPGCQSVRALGVRHGMIHRAPETSAEVLRILGERG
jgi:pimeloyl-ACP methyl ester carboxylesterase